MNKASVLHRVDSEYCYLISEETCVLRLRCAKEDLNEVTVFYGNRFAPLPMESVKEIKMTKVASGVLHDYYQVTITPGYHRMFYYFKLTDNFESIYYYSGEFHTRLSQIFSDYYQIPYFRREEVYEVPEWTRNAVMYQIFPDSFATDKKIHDKLPKTASYNGLELKTKLGGTLKGIINNIDYLVELGINVVYLNPIFVARSYHKYNTIDYKHIDPCLGTDEEFAELVKLLHKNGIKIILDGVFNHSGSYFFAYQDILVNQEKSKYASWYYDIKFPLLKDFKSDYECFGYVKDMPKLNTGNKETADYLIGVGTYWIEKYDIDGWRLDVANEIDKNFWRNYKKAVKSIKKDVILIGEIWEDAQNWQVYDEFDSAMNYRFQSICRAFFADRKINALEFGERFSESLMRYPEIISYTQMNLLDSHDVSRFISLCADNALLLKLAALVQFTLPGMPSIFAGDERAMTGITEDDYRRVFVWDNKGNNCDYVACRPEEMTEFYKMLIKLRKEHKCLTDGKIVFIDSGSDDVLAYKRYTDDESMIVYINNGSSVYTDVVNSIQIEPWSFSIQKL